MPVSEADADGKGVVSVLEVKRSVAAADFEAKAGYYHRITPSMCQ